MDECLSVEDVFSLKDDNAPTELCPKLKLKEIHYYHLPNKLTRILLPERLVYIALRYYLTELDVDVPGENTDSADICLGLALSAIFESQV